MDSHSRALPGIRQDRLEIAAGLASAMLARPGGFSVAWHYEEGLAAMAIDVAGRALGRPEFSERALGAVAALVRPDGSIVGYREEDYNLDQVNPGKNLFRLLERSGDDRYAKAMHSLRGQLERQPRCPSGGFWHKKIYPDQMWLDGLYMAQPFLARYAAFFDRPRDFEEVARQFGIIAEAAADSGTGLLRHAWDESRAMPWADRATGASPHVWGRAMGWFMMALVDSLECFPAGHPGKETLNGILARLAPPLVAAQEAESGLWWQVMDQPGRDGNYMEASASAMFSYALAKAVRLGSLPADPFSAVAGRALDGLAGRLIVSDPDGSLHLEGTCAVAGLGGKPYRDGSFGYYVGEPRKRDDFKGLGPCILAALENGGAA